MSRAETKPTTFKLTAGEEKALQELALAGHVIDPDVFSNRTKVGVVRRAIREAWVACEATKDKPFPGNSDG